jgi:competence protein ComEA
MVTLLAQVKLPDGPGKSAFVKVCSDCHSPESAVSMLRTREEWTATLGQMAQMGAQGTDQEFEQILEYLVTNFSPIQMNQATAKELESALDIPANIAEAIVSYRQEKGSFKSVDDLKKVPGLDAEKVDARKDRLTFGSQN